MGELLCCCVALSFFLSISVLELSCKSLSGLTSLIVISCIHVHVHVHVHAPVKYMYVYLDVPARKKVEVFLEKSGLCLTDITICTLDYQTNLLSSASEGD